MFEKNHFNPAVLLLIFGLYFILDFVSTKCIPNLLYGLFLVSCYIRIIFLYKKRI